MSNITMGGATTAALAEAADANFVVHAGWVPERTPGMQVRDQAGLFVAASGLPCDTFNIICRARLAAEQAPAQIKATLDFFELLKHPFSWWLGPADQPAQLGDLLRQAGLEQAETELAMAADLASLRTDHVSPSDVQVRRVRSPGELRDFADVVAANWTPPDSQVHRFYERAAPVLLAEGCPQRLYVGYVSNQPVAAAEGVVGGGVVGLYNICTRADFRRRGFGTILTLQALLDARASGVRTGVLQASASGAGVYSRIGFASFGSITEYKPRLSV